MSRRTREHRARLAVIGKRGTTKNGWPFPSVKRPAMRRGTLLGASGSLAENEPAGREQVPPCVAFVTPPRAVSTDFPSWRVMSAGRAAHVHAVALEMQDGIVASKPAKQLSEAAHRTGHDGVGYVVVRDFRGGRELLGVVGHHGRSPCSLLNDRLALMTPSHTRSFRSAGLMNIKRCAMEGHGRPIRRQSSGLAGEGVDRAVAVGWVLCSDAHCCGAVHYTGAPALYVLPDDCRSWSMLRITNPMFAGRSPSRRMKYGNHSRPNGT